MEYAPFVGKKLCPYVMHCSDVILQRKFGVGGRSAQSKSVQRTKTSLILLWDYYMQEQLETWR